MKNSFYDPNHHRGIQPVRVLENNVTHALDDLYRKFPEELRTQIDLKRPQNAILYAGDPEPIFPEGKHNTPYIDGNRQIHLHETFLSYVWCVCYFIGTYYIEAVEKPSKTNPGGGADLTKIDKRPLETANSVISYGFSLIGTFTEWDKNNLPNPELQSPNESAHIGKINGLFVYACLYILCHEFAHSVLGHTTRVAYSARQSKEWEEEADKYAYTMIRDGTDHNKKFSSELGTICGLVAILLLNKWVNSNTHPDSDKRIKDFMEFLEIEDDNDAIWAAPCFGLKIWDLKYENDLEWGDREGTYKDLFYRIIDQ